MVLLLPAQAVVHFLGYNVELDAVGMIAALSCSIRIGGHKGRDGGGGGGGIGRTPTEDISPSSEETEEQ